MTNKELQEKLKEFPDDIIVTYDCDGRYTTTTIDELSIHPEYYIKDCEKVLVLY